MLCIVDNHDYIWHIICAKGFLDSNLSGQNIIFFRTLTQISHAHKKRNFNWKEKDQLFLPYKFYDGDI